MKKLLFGVFLIVPVILVLAGRARGMGEILGETKEELKLKYEVTVSDPVNGQVGVEFILGDEGRLKPLDAVELMIPRQDGSGSYDLAVPLAIREWNGKRVARFHLKTEWAARAEIWLNTYWFDGKQLVMTHYHHLIPLANYMGKAAAPKPATPADARTPAPPATNNPKE